jgi:hypothetical protein
MKEIVIEYAGELIAHRVASDARFVVVSRQRDGSMRIQRTAHPSTSIALASQAGDTDLQTATIVRGEAVFDTPPQALGPVGVSQLDENSPAARRNRALQAWATVLIVLFIVIALIWATT